MASQLYRFKDIATIPQVTELIDIVLSKTQRKTPTEVHKQFKISRIRSFYMRKVKFCQQTFNEKLSQIINQFPRLDEIHPFYSDLCNVLYDRDHYKLALGQCNSTRSLIDNIAKDYVRLMKYADSLYKCKMLKRAALGRMCTALSKLKSCLPYLEEVRQHLARLPSINPNSRTLILTGYPNVGKSSFMNVVSNANVEVQPYAFTTKSLFVGHFDYAYTRWQIIDTPGILDHPLEERNTIEMTAITALAHIQAAVIYIFDLSELCGYTISAQAQLFHSIKPLFHNKPLIILINKIDVKSMNDLTKEESQVFDSLLKENHNVEIFYTSTLTGMGVDEAKNKACDILLKQKMSELGESKSFQKVIDRIYIADQPLSSSRPASIPESVIKRRLNALNKNSTTENEASKPKLEKDFENELGGPGVYSYDLRKNYDLKLQEWKYDVVPEIFDGKNVVDYVDPEIQEKLKILEQEEELLLGQDQFPLDHEFKAVQNSLKAIHLRTKQIITENKLRKSRQGLNMSQRMLNRKSKLKNLTNALHKLGASQSINSNSIEQNFPTELNSISNSKSKSTTNKSELAINKKIHPINKKVLASSRPNQIKRMEKVQRDAQKVRNRKGMQGEGDHFIGDKKPKHLFSGKSGLGKRNRR